MPEAALSLTGAAVVLCAAWSAGRLAARGQPVAVQFALGIPLLALVVLALLSAGRWSAWWIVAAAGVGLVQARPSIRSVPARALLAAPFAALYLIHALAPETQPDAYAYHLGLPAEWLRLGGFSDRAGYYEVLPLALETLFLGAISLAGYPAAKLVHLACLAACVALILRAGRDRGFEAAPAAVLFACAPVVGMASAAAYNDTALALLALVCFHLLSEERPSAFLAGLAAGGCYAVKLPGILAIPAVAAVLAIRLGPRAGLTALAGAAVTAGPWLLRAWWTTGNPVAPLCNEIFPNPAFHSSTHHHLNAFLAGHELSWFRLPWEVTVWGGATSGLVGPVFLAAPAALLAVRVPAARPLLIAGAIAAVPWFLNAGARFLIPALAFVSLALAAALPRRVAWMLAAVHALLSWPAAMDLYTASDAWRLRGFPWRAALGVESPADYLRARSPEFRVAEMVNRHVPPNALILDLGFSANAYHHAPAVAPWHTSAADLAVETLQMAMRQDRYSLCERTAPFPERTLDAVRIQLGGSEPRVHEWRLLGRDGPLFPTSAWELDASVNPWELPLAFDRNPATFWQPWRVRPGPAWIEVTFAQPTPLAGVSLTVPCTDRGVALAIEGRAANQWSELARDPVPKPLVALSLRASAMRLAHRQGFRYVLAVMVGGGYSELGATLVRDPASWGLERVAESGGVHLLRIRYPAERGQE